MIGVVIPAHNEERELEQCLAAVRAAAVHAALGGEAVRVTVVLDSCSDDSRAIVERHAVLTAAGACVVDCIVVASRNVGAARAAGAAHLLGLGLGVRWLAYLSAGGFEPLACSEDVALVAALERCGARVAWSSAPRVVTSARTNARASGGFGDTLLRYAAGARAVLPADLPVLLNNSHNAA